jgi:WD40 repeat protein
MRRPVNTATLLPNGTVLVAGGSGTSAELYNPVTGSWRATGSMGTARDYDMMATLLPDGRVLVLGGDYNSGGNGTSAELYDPSRGSWTASPTMLIAGSMATLLPDGTVLVAGHGATWSPPGSAELYTPSGT